MSEVRENFQVDLGNYFAGLSRADGAAAATDAKIQRAQAKAAALQARVTKAQTDVSLVESAVSRVEARILKRAVRAGLVGVGSYALGSALGQSVGAAYSFIEAGVSGFVMGGPVVAAINVASRGVMTLFGKVQELGQRIDAANKRVEEQAEQQRHRFDVSWMRHEREIRERAKELEELRAELALQAQERAKDLVLQTARYLED